MKPVISVENLGKRYRIRHRADNEPTNFRELLADLPRKLLKGGMKTQTADFWALKDVAFDIMPGERVGIIGRNGAGKSTLLKLLSRITEPTTGRISMRGRVASLLEVGTGFHPELTGRENIYLNGAILGMQRAEITKKFGEIVDFAGVEKFLDTPVKRYSSGMYVRLAFAVAAHLEPEILIVDEVLAVGDMEFQKKCLGKMEEVSKGEGRTVLFVSHNLLAVQQLCVKAYLLASGQIKKTGFVQHVINDYVYEHVVHRGEWVLSSEECVKSKHFYPKRIAVVDEGQNIVAGTISCSQQISIVIEGFCEDSIPGLQVGFAIYNAEGTTVLWSFHTDDSNASRWPKLLNGANTFIIPLPQNLNSGRYKVQFLLAVYSRYWVLSPKESEIFVEFELTPPQQQSIYLTGDRPGVLFSSLLWNNQ